MKKSFLVPLLFTSLFSKAQRWYAINDLTTYNYQNLYITVDRHKVYLNTNNNLTLIRDFDINNAQIPEDYIRDFDFIDADTWFVLVGSRYIGHTTELYRTDDAGTTWQVITPQAQLFGPYVGSDGIADSINQIQVINSRIYLFDAYYISRVFYSDDFGLTWNHWFQGFWSHYYQIFVCGNDLYLQGIQGDGFTNYMVKIPDSFTGQVNLFPQPNLGSCHNGGTGCYYASSSLTVPEVYNYFKDLVENTICNALDINESTINEITVYPNPAINSTSLEGIDTTIPFSISVYNGLGQKCLEVKNKLAIDLTSLESGIYFMTVIQNKITKTIKVIKQ